MKNTSLFLLTATAMVLFACGRTNPSPANLCDTAECPAGTECDPADGTCKAPDATDDAGTGTETDAGTDSDAGVETDAGMDTDAGTETDGGVEADGGTLPPCDATCLPPMVCDLTANNGAGACVTCTATVGCTSPTPVCDTQVPGGECVECLGDGDCFGQTPVCDTTSRSCVGCLSNADCGGAVPVCDTQKQTCVGCASSADCSAPTPVCDTTTATCIGCGSNADCSGTTPICDTTAQTCGPCTSNAQCGAGKYCGFDGSCLVLPDTCSQAQTLQFIQGSNTAGFQANTATAQDDETGSCNATGPELVYHLNLPTARDVTITAQRAANSTANPVIYLRSSPCATGTQLGCSNNANFPAANETINLLNLAAGDYYLFVESAGTSTGAINVTVTLNTPSIPPSNDTCATAQVLSFTNGAASVTGTTVNATNGNPTGANTPTCSTSSAQTGTDVVYEFTITQTQNVTATVTPTSANYRPTIYVRGPSTTNACDSDTQLNCASVGNNNIAPQTVSMPNLAAGTYYIWVDSALGTSGTFNLSVNLSTPVANDTCSGPTALTFTNNQATVSGDTTFASNDNTGTDPSPTCSTSAKQNGKDLVYSYTLTQAQDVTITVTPTGTTPTFQPVVYVRTDGNCTSNATANELGCEADFTATPQTLTFIAQPAGTYFIWVDGAQQTAGPFNLSVSLATPAPPPANDACPGTALTFNGATATATGSTVSATNGNSSGDFVPTCSTAARNSGKDVVYSYTLTQARDVTITLTPSAGFEPALYVKKGTCGSFAISDELTCRAGTNSNPLTYTLLNQPAGTYWVFVDGNNNTAGTFQLSVTTAAPTQPPANDSCAGAQVLTFNQGQATATGNTTTASNDNSASDASPTCSPTAKQKGRDLIYKFTLTQPRDVTVNAQRSGFNNPLVPVVYLRGAGASACTSISAGSEQLCAEATNFQVTSTAYNLPAGDYFVWVDGANDTWGAFNLTVTLGGPTLPPANDTCTAPQTITVGNIVTGNTAVAIDDYSASSTPAYSAACLTAANFPFTGKDVVYQFTATGTQHTITVNPGTTFDPALLVLQPMCGAGSCVQAQDTPGENVNESLTLTTVPGNVYYLVVDNWNAAAPFTSGTYVIYVQ